MVSQRMVSTMGKWRSKLYKTDRARDFDHERDRQVRARQVYETVDRQPFQWIVVLVAGIGFFVDGYTLFASNLALPMIAYVYWHDEMSHDKMSAINTATMAGIVLGQLVFGVLADQKGRKKMYGMELIVLTVSTIGVAMASTGSHDSMSIFSWLIFWRFLVGISVGADYPLSAVITSEFAPTAQRARMMAAVFMMQPLGQVASTAVSMAVITLTRRSTGTEDLTRSVDIMWRWIIGMGVVPSILAMLFRFAIPETPRFMLEIEDDPVKAEFDATYLFGDSDGKEDIVCPSSTELESVMWALDTKVAVHRPVPSISNGKSSQVFLCGDYDYDHDFEGSPTSTVMDADWTLASPPTPTLKGKWSRTRTDIYQFFIVERNYITLLCTSLCWLLLDFGFYGIGTSSPHYLAKIWGNLDIHGRRPPWQITDDPNVSIFDTFFSTSLHALIILNLGSLVGSGLLVATINRLNRVTLQKYGFLFLATLFIVMGTLFITNSLSREGPIAIVLYIVAQIAFNFGPNATTYILPAELFPTRYRTTCHGIASAVGKVGAMLVQLVGSAAAHHARQNNNTPTGQFSSVTADTTHEDRAARYGRVLIGFGAAMVLGFIVSFGIPQVQEEASTRRNARDETANKSNSHLERLRAAIKSCALWNPRLKSKTLEELSLGRLGHRSATVSRNQRSTWI